MIKKPSLLQLLEKVTTDCLDLATKRNARSVLFSAMGTGGLKYPSHVVAQHMVQAVIKFNEKNPKTTVKKTKFVLYPKDTHVIEVIYLV